MKSFAKISFGSLYSVLAVLKIYLKLRYFRFCAARPSGRSLECRVLFSKVQELRKVQELFKVGIPACG